MKLPKQFFGVDTKEALEKVLKEDSSKDPIIPATANPIVTPNLQNVDNFIQLDINGLNGNQVLISPYELQGYNNLDYDNTHIKLLKNGLYMPNPNIFMNFFTRVIDAYNNKAKLYNAKGKQLSTQELTDIYKHLTINHIDIYNVNNPGAGTWLNGKFKKLNDKWDLETVIGLNKDDLLTKSEGLEPCLKEDCYASLTFNKQGLAIQKDPNQSYIQRKNIQFWYPRDGAVAGFGADSDRAGLGCGWGLLGSWFSGNGAGWLGVFGCCEATQKNGAKQ